MCVEWCKPSCVVYFKSSDSEQKNKCHRLIGVFNLLLRNETLTQVHSDHFDDFKTYGFLSDPTNVDQALYTAYSLPSTRHMYLDACRYMCHVLNCCQTDADPKWFKLAAAYETVYNARDNGWFTSDGEISGVTWTVCESAHTHARAGGWASVCGCFATHTYPYT